MTVLNVLMRTAVEWDVIERVPCSIKMLRTPRTEASFYEFDQFERLVDTVRAGVNCRSPAAVSSLARTRTRRTVQPMLA